MNKLNLFGQPYRIGKKTINPSISIVAARPYEFYKPYVYFAAHSSDKPMNFAKYNIHDKYSGDEWLIRARRTALFSDATNLAPVKFNKFKHGKLLDRVCLAMHCDHLTCWVSPSGTMFILNEPYLNDPNYLIKLRSQELIGVVVPIDLSPYCGGWNPNLGSKPGTVSYLICNISDADELAHLFSRLDLEQIPAWNCTKGVQHV